MMLREADCQYGLVFCLSTIRHGRGLVKSIMPPLGCWFYCSAFQLESISLSEYPYQCIVEDGLCVESKILWKGEDV